MEARVHKGVCFLFIGVRRVKGKGETVQRKGLMKREGSAVQQSSAAHERQGEK